MMCRRRAEPLPVFDRRLFDEFIRRGFAQRRKMLRKALPSEKSWPEVAAAIACSETARPEELSLEQWVALTRNYDETSSEPAQKGDELFDVVDEDNEVIAQASRSEVHERDLRHRAVHVLIRDDKGQILLAQRSALKDREAGKWGSSAAGHLDSGEDYEPAARRELGEELGINVSDLELTVVGERGPSQANGWEFIRLYEGRYSGALRLNTSEVAAVQWMSWGGLADWLTRRPQDFSGSFRELWEMVARNSER
jgi:16S rRNA (adenine1518-N6/adenine1519-N6)-dimethyltransferase